MKNFWGRAKFHFFFQTADKSYFWILDWYPFDDKFSDLLGNYYQWAMKKSVEINDFYGFNYWSPPLKNDLICQCKDSDFWYSRTFDIHPITGEEGCYYYCEDCGKIKD